MEANDWWMTISLFLWFFNTVATGLLLFYFYGICKLAERKFAARTYPVLLAFFFLLMGISTLIYSVSYSIVAINWWHAVWPALGGILLLVVVYRVYAVMMKK